VCDGVDFVGGEADGLGGEEVDGLAELVTEPNWPAALDAIVVDESAGVVRPLRCKRGRLGVARRAGTTSVVRPVSKVDSAVASEGSRSCPLRFTVAPVTRPTAKPATATAIPNRIVAIMRLRVCGCCDRSVCPTKFKRRLNIGVHVTVGRPALPRAPNR
jgi:hypothetical protein